MLLLYLNYTLWYLKVAARPILWGYAVPLVFMYPLLQSSTLPTGGFPACQWPGWREGSYASPSMVQLHITHYICWLVAPDCWSVARTYWYIESYFHVNEGEVRDERFGWDTRWNAFMTQYLTNFMPLSIWAYNLNLQSGTHPYIKGTHHHAEVGRIRKGYSLTSEKYSPKHLNILNKALLAIIAKYVFRIGKWGLKGLMYQALLRHLRTQYIANSVRTMIGQPN